MTDKRILVLGGTGFVGHHLCRHLSQQGVQITVVTRSFPARTVQMLPGVSLVQADVFHPDALERLISEHDEVVNLVAILHGSARAFDRVHVELPRRIVLACQRTGVRRLVHVSALGANVLAASNYQKSKAAGEAVLQQAADEGFLDLTILRPSVIFGADDSFINLFAQLQKIFPVVPLAGANTQFQPVWVGDVVRAIGISLMHRQTIGQAYELCGAEVFTLKELVKIAANYIGRQRLVIDLPYAAGYLQALLMEIAPGKTLMSRDNLASMKVHNISQGGLNLSDLGIDSPKQIRDIFPSSR
jgi:uncharacterized protein YbjT (DUF2867 family)